MEHGTRVAVAAVLAVVAIGTGSVLVAGFGLGVFAFLVMLGLMSRPPLVRLLSRWRPRPVRLAPLRWRVGPARQGRSPRRAA